jgi:hypothetical protein
MQGLARRNALLNILPSVNRLSASHISLALAAISLLMFLVVFLLDDQIITWAIKTYSRKGTVTPTGYNRIVGTLARAKTGFAAGGLSCAIFALILWYAERAMAKANFGRPFKSSSAESVFRIGILTGVIIFGLSALRFSIGMAHIGDSLWCDELFTVKNFGSPPIYNIFGFSQSSLPNNHILNSLLVKLSLTMGFTSEAGLRIWNFIASLLTIPAAYYLGSVLKLKRSSLLIFLAIISTSPVIDRYGTQARGYGLAILLATLSIALHLDCFSRPSKVRFSALLIVNTLLILANLFTLPLVCGQLLHLVIEGLYPNSQARIEGYMWYSQHMLTLVFSICVVIASYIFLLPFIFLNSMLAASRKQVSPSVILESFSWIFTQEGSVTLGGILLIVLVGYGLLRKREKIETRASLALYCILFCGICVSMIAHIFQARAVAYLHTAFIAILVLAESHLRRWRFTLPVTVVLVSFICIYGVYLSVSRPMIQDYRGMIQEAEKIANGRMMWTSGFASEGVEYYGDMVSVPTEFPDKPSIYLSFFDWVVKNDDLQQRVMSKCQVMREYPSELKMAIYECP